MSPVEGAAQLRVAADGACAPPLNARSFDGSAPPSATDREAEKCSSDDEDGGRERRHQPGLATPPGPGEAEIRSQNVNGQGDVAEDRLTVHDWKAVDRAAVSNAVVAILAPFEKQHGRPTAFDVGTDATHPVHSNVDLPSDR